MIKYYSKSIFKSEKNLSRIIKNVTTLYNIVLKKDRLYPVVGYSLCTKSKYLSSDYLFTTEFQ